MNLKESKNKWDINCIHLSFPLNIRQLRHWNVIFKPQNELSLDPSSSDKESFIMCQHASICSSTVWKLFMLLVVWAHLLTPHSRAMSYIWMQHATQCYLIKLHFWGLRIVRTLFFLQMIYYAWKVPTVILWFNLYLLEGFLSSNVNNNSGSWISWIWW